MGYYAKKLLTFFYKVGLESTALCQYLKENIQNGAMEFFGSTLEAAAPCFTSVGRHGTEGRGPTAPDRLAFGCIRLRYGLQYPAILLTTTLCSTNRVDYDE